MIECLLFRRKKSLFSHSLRMNNFFHNGKRNHPDGSGLRKTRSKGHKEHKGYAFSVLKESEV